MDETHNSQNKKYDADNDDETLHAFQAITIAGLCGNDGCKAPPCAGVAWGTENSRTGSSGCGFLGCLSGFGGGGGLAAALGLRRGGGSFADEFGRHDNGKEQLLGLVVKIHPWTASGGSGHDPQSIQPMFDGVTFLHY